MVAIGDLRVGQVVALQGRLPNVRPSTFISAASAQPNKKNGAHTYRGNGHDSGNDD